MSTEEVQQQQQQGEGTGEVRVGSGALCAQAEGGQGLLAELLHVAGALHNQTAGLAAVTRRAKDRFSVWQTDSD